MSDTKPSTQGRQALYLVVALTFAFASYVGLRAWKDKQDEQSSNEKKIADVDADAVQMVSIHRPNLPDVKFERKGDDWWLVEPEQYKANTITVNSMITSLNSRERMKSFVADDLEMFELNPPKYVVVFASNPTEVVLNIGKNTPVAKNVYVLGKDGKTVDMVSGGFEYNFEKPVQDYRSRDLFWAFPSAVSAVSMFYEGASTAFERRDAKWVAGELELANDKVDTYFSRLKNITIQDFMVDAPVDYEAFGFDGSKQLTLISPAGTEVVSVGAKSDENNYFVRVKSRPNVYKVGKYALDPMFKSLEDLTPPPPVTTPTEADGEIEDAPQPDDGSQ